MRNTSPFDPCSHCSTSCILPEARSVDTPVCAPAPLCTWGKTAESDEVEHGELKERTVNILSQEIDYFFLFCFAFISSLHCQGQILGRRSIFTEGEGPAII